MGLSLFGGSSSSFDPQPEPRVVEKIVYKDRKLPNPDPFNYVIERILQQGPFLILGILYPDCTNYEGRKVLVFFNATLEQLHQQKAIDPHFSGNQKYHSPIARFVPTEAGWAMAIRFVDAMNSLKEFSH